MASTEQEFSVKCALDLIRYKKHVIKIVVQIFYRTILIFIENISLKCEIIFDMMNRSIGQFNAVKYNLFFSDMCIVYINSISNILVGKALSLSKQNGFIKHAFCETGKEKTL